MTDWGEVFWGIEQALAALHRGFTYDDRNKSIRCADCTWGRDSIGFLDAVSKHGDHKRNMQLDALHAYEASL